jgi:hypothetical protein
VTSSERGLISEQVHRNLLTSAIVLSCPPRDGFTPTEECLPFTIPFPSHVADGTSPLPPSCAWWSSTFSTQVEYCVRVDVHRKGLRRHELYGLFCHAFVSDDRPSRRIIPIMYLPKTWPSHPIPSRESIFGPLPSSTEYKTVSLHPESPTDVPPKAMATMPTVEASFTNTCIYHYAHRTVVVLPIRRYICLRSIHSPQAYYPQYRVSRSGTTAHPRAGSPIGKVYGSTETKRSGC